MSKERELINEMDKIIMKKYKPIGYLDRKEVEKIVSKYMSQKLYSYNIVDKIATEICRLQSKNQKIIFKAKLEKGIILTKVIGQVLYPKYIGKEIIILEEE